LPVTPVTSDIPKVQRESEKRLNLLLLASGCRCGLLLPASGCCRRCGLLLLASLETAAICLVPGGRRAGFSPNGGDHECADATFDGAISKPMR
jgi:hypothetical protein